ncbi:MAG TPA: NifU N-terminal domain-containing protein [Gemmatimonadota bacterium]|nr:NifU N-terminal domain-containing protein [Gemmatimonadota bacterium]
MSEVEIRVEGTPNPNAAKFTLSRPLPSDESRSYFDAASAAGDPLAERLFGVKGVEALLMVDNFITVTKVESARWDELVPPIRTAIREALSEG